MEVRLGLVNDVNHGSIRGFQSHAPWLIGSVRVACTMSRAAACYPSGRDGVGQAEGQARNARGEPRQVDPAPIGRPGSLGQLNSRRTIAVAAEPLYFAKRHRPLFNGHLYNEDSDAALTAAGRAIFISKGSFHSSLSIVRSTCESSLHAR
jgi:hypothetical protein